ncbi:hypothetical protein Bbelb_278650 [Branchiostoma belcheri]|nr:hypothetical protein Bbelb_278650 [Branchiostoma belcheri]
MRAPRKRQQSAMSAVTYAMVWNRVNDRSQRDSSERAQGNIALTALSLRPEKRGESAKVTLGGYKNCDLGTIVALSPRYDQCQVAESAQRSAKRASALFRALANFSSRRERRASATKWNGGLTSHDPSSQCRWSDGSVLGAGDFDDWSLGQPGTIYREKCGEIRSQCSYHCNNHHCGVKGPILNCKFFIKDSCRLWKTEKIEQPPLHTGSQTQYLLPHGPSACSDLILGYYKGPLDGITE